MRRRLLALLLWAGGSGCTAATPLYCDDQTPCATGMHCDRVHNRCLSDSSVDSGVDRPNGTGCDDKAQCTSAHCVDAVCCEDACPGTCMTCALDGLKGACHPVLVGSDPRNDCVSGWPESPSCTASCDGNGHCMARETVCVTTLAGNGVAGYVDGVETSQFSSPRGVSVNHEGKVYVADTGNGVIRVIHAEQTTTHPLFRPGTLTSPTAVAEWDTVIVVADPMTHSLLTEDVFKVTTLVGTGQPGFANGPLAGAQLSSPYALATDGSLQLVGDVVSVRQIVDDQLSVVAGNGVAGFADGAVAQARLDRVRGLAVDSIGTIYVVEQESHRIRTIAGGVVSTVAGNGTTGCLDGPAASATIDSPGGIAVDTATGRVYFTDCGRLRMLDNGTVSTVAGFSFGNADGFGSKAQFSSELGGLVMLTSTKICIADTGNHSIRLVWLH